MAPPRTIRFVLRDATAEWHRRVDDVFSTADLGSRAGYGDFLTAQAAAHLPVERALDAAGVESLLPDWPLRQRADLLLDDLRAMNLPRPALAPAPAFASPAAMLGAAYVLEGSRLGGAVLRRSVPAAFPSRFLSGGNSEMWRNLILLIDAAIASDDEVDAAIEAACHVFALFEKSGRRFMTNGQVFERT